VGQEVPQDQEAPQDRVRLFDRPAPPRQVPLSARHNLMRKWTMQLRLRYL
jgi:hypothetical protein